MRLCGFNTEYVRNVVGGDRRHSHFSGGARAKIDGFKQGLVNGNSIFQCTEQRLSQQVLHDIFVLAYGRHPFIGMYHR